MLWGSPGPASSFGKSRKESASDCVMNGGGMLLSNGGSAAIGANAGSQADLYNVMMHMFLSPTDDLGKNQLFVSQKMLQIILLFLAPISVPWVLFPKPFLLQKEHQEVCPTLSFTVLTELESHHDFLGHVDFEFIEAFVHQLIHTIEFVPGAVSNTASYLHLWALRFNNGVILTIGIIVFIFTTVGVLLIMETLKCIP